MISKLETISPIDALIGESYLLDTCFVIYEIEKGNTKKLEKFCKENSVYMTSFNLEELEKVEKRIANIKHLVRVFLKKKLIKRIELEVHIGQVDKEKLFADKIDEHVLKEIADSSDAVMVATAIMTKSHILTRDKHHVFTAQL